MNIINKSTERTKLIVIDDWSGAIPQDTNWTVEATNGCGVVIAGVLMGAKVVVPAFDKLIVVNPMTK